jgi:hypothetical protein
MTSRPYYGRFELDFGLKAGLRIVAADTPLELCLQPNVVDIFEQTLQQSKANGVEVRALLIVNPHNPLGIQNIPPNNERCILTSFRAMLSERDISRYHEVLPKASTAPHQR